MVQNRIFYFVLTQLNKESTVKMLYKVDINDFVNQAAKSQEQIPERLKNVQWLVYESSSIPPFLIPGMSVRLPLKEPIDCLYWIVHDNPEMGCDLPEWNEETETFEIVLLPKEDGTSEMPLDIEDLNILLNSGWITDTEYWQHGLRSK